MMTDSMSVPDATGTIVPVVAVILSLLAAVSVV